jgi:cell wall hydrolase
MRTLVTALLGSFALAIPSFGMPVPIPESHPVQQLDIQSRDFVAETELYCLALAIYFEGGSTREPEIGQRHIARVITARAMADRPYWGGNTICGVVFYKKSKTCQFSFACLPLARRTPKKNELWYQSEAIAQDALAGRNDEPDESLRYYMNAKLSALKNVCAFRKEFVPVVKAGSHEFFREATTAERAALAKSNPDECQRYAESLKAKKKKKTRHARAGHKKAAVRTARR